jgi:octaprenyl-diphosphate synthase
MMKTRRAGQTLTDPHVITRLTPLFDRINQELQSSLASDVPYISQVSRHSLLSSGKRIRPVLFILSARLCGYQGTEDVRYSAMFEFLHAASLMHDDVVDESETRRGQIAAHVAYGNKAAILVGDYLLAKAVSQAVSNRSFEFIEVMARTALLLSEGEILQLLHNRDAEITEAEYQRIIYRKTATLIEAACELGAVMAEAPPERRQALAGFGRKIGLAFQIIDDVLDYTTTETELGKPVGQDLDEGLITLPLILALARAGDEERRRILPLILKERRTLTEFEAVLAFIHAHGGVAAAMADAQRSIAEAKAGLMGLPDRPERQDLLDLADFIVSRRK